MSEETQYRKTISHTLVLHDPLSHGHILPAANFSRRKPNGCGNTPEKSQCFSEESFCKMFHKMFAEIRAKRQEWLSPSLTIYDNHLCGDECNSEVHSNRTEENQFFFPLQTIHIVSKTHLASSIHTASITHLRHTYFKILLKPVTFWAGAAIPKKLFHRWYICNLQKNVPMTNPPLPPPSQSGCQTYNTVISLCCPSSRDYIILTCPISLLSDTFMELCNEFFIIVLTTTDSDMVWISWF